MITKTTVTSIKCGMLFMLFSLYFTARVFAQPYLISTVAGDGTFGYTGDGGAATAADLTPNYGIAADGSGNFYIACGSDNVVRMVNSSGVISTIAGTGLPGYTGDGGAATAAKLNNPIGVAYSGGILYIADAGNNVVREIQSGIISTFAGDGTPGWSGDGGAATSAELNFPVAMAIDGSGDVYIADEDNNRVRVVSSGTINTYAGNGTSGYTGDGGAAATAELYHPTGVAVYAHNLYIADNGNYVVRVVNTGSGIINTFAGTGATGFSGDGGPATAAVFAAGGPYGIATDPAGNLDIADVNNNRIRQVNTSGTINTIAGNGSPGFAGDGGPAIAAELKVPYCVAVDATAAADVYITDVLNYRVRELTPATVPNVVPAVNADTALAYTAEAFGTGMIYYGGTAISLPPVNSAIFGAAWISKDTVYVHDLGTGITAICPITTPVITHHFLTTPDVVIGDNTGSPGNYIMAVVNVYNVTLTTGYVAVDFYDITNTGTASLTVAYNSTVTISIGTAFVPMTTSLINVAHIDLIAAYSSTPPPPLPPCNKFILTYDDISSGSIVWAAEGDLSTYSVGTPVVIAPSSIGGGSQPDVAAIQRTVGAAVDDIGLITYVNGSGNLMYAECDFTPLIPVVSTPVTLDNTATFITPRIDANDNYNTNALPSLTAQYKIAAGIVNNSIFIRPVITDFRTYDNLMGPGVYFGSADLMNLSGYGYPGPYFHCTPTVALMNNDQFAVYHYTDVMGGPPNDIAMMEPIDRSTSYTLNPNAYYCVSATGVTPVMDSLPWYTATGFSNSVSASVNYNFSTSSLTLFAWAEAMGTPTTKFKVTQSGSSLAFRHVQPTPAVQNAQSLKWKVFPNPAGSLLTIINGTGTEKATRYQVTDIVGSEVTAGTVTGSSQDVNIGGLVPGSYIIQLYNGNHSCGSSLFVKN